MEPKSSKLESLPGNESKFWEEADIHANLIPHHEFNEDGHYFVRVSGNSAQCKKCNWGFDLEIGDEIKDGHLYNYDKIII